jgi:hypothetical protein
VAHLQLPRELSAITLFMRAATLCTSDKHDTVFLFERRFSVGAIDGSPFREVGEPSFPHWFVV